MRIAAIVLAMAGLLAAGVGNRAGEAPAGNYSGADSCGSCHKSAVEKWKTTKHAKAWEALGSAGAKQIAADRKIEDPRTGEACRKCHVTALRASAHRLPEKIQEKGIQCEACHGPAARHIKARKAEDEETAPDEIRRKALLEMPLPTKEICARCHNEESPSIEKSPYWDKTTKGFDAEKAWKEIEHPRKKGN